MPERLAPDSALEPLGPILLADRFPPLHAALMALLHDLDPDDWGKPTVCPQWTVKDITAHLLDSQLRRLSFGRDRLPAQPDLAIASYADLVAYLNRLNAGWVAAARRLSPRLLIDLLDVSAPQLHAYFQSLDPDAPADFGVAWAGEDQSPVWFDIGREYTERWLHQQQIREAVGMPGLISREWLNPVFNVFLRALPHTYRDTPAPRGTTIRLHILGEAGGVWTLVREREAWELFLGIGPNPKAQATLDQDTAWKLFSKGLAPGGARSQVRVEGDRALAEPIFGALAVMA
jgi:uncharacterized protein (TIGR03083 family)